MQSSERPSRFPQLRHQNHVPMFMHTWSRPGLAPGVMNTLISLMCRLVVDGVIGVESGGFSTSGVPVTGRFPHPLYIKMISIYTRACVYPRFTGKGLLRLQQWNLEQTHNPKLPVRQLDSSGTVPPTQVWQFARSMLFGNTPGHLFSTVPWGLLVGVHST